MSETTATKTSTGRTGVSVLKKYFGLKDGESLKDFAGETKQLTDQDFDQLKTGIEDGSFTY